MGCCEDFGKLIMFFMNLLFSLLGAALIGIGVFWHLKLQKALEESDLLVKISPYIAISLGSIIVLVAFCGCWGALTDTSSMLCCYSLFMLLLIILNLSVGVLLFVKKDVIGDKVVEELLNIEDIKTFLFISEKFNCCTEDTCAALNFDAELCIKDIGNSFVKLSWIIALVLCVTAGVQILAIVTALCLRSNVEFKRHLHHEHYHSSCL